MRLASYSLSLALAWGSGSAGVAVSPVERALLIEEIAPLLREEYVDPELGSIAAASVTDLETSGGLDDAATPADLAGALTHHLQQIDGHFRVDWNPPSADGATPLDHHSEAGEAAWRAWSRLQNRGFRKAEVLAGNVGYLDLRYFDQAADAGDVAAATMAMLAGSDALIVDLRRNGGGEPEMVRLLISYFLPAGTHYNSLYWRSPERLDELRALPDLPGRRLLDLPLYVLISARTGSAAESFAYSLQALGRAEIIGRRSAGAANPGRTFPLGGGYSIFVSTGKAINPVTGDSWEGTGVRPDLELVDEDALGVAYGRALAGLLEDAVEPVQRRALSWAKQDLDLVANPYEIEPELLEGYVGTYGDRRIGLDDDRLSYRRAQRAAHAMVPAGADLFLLEGVDGFRTRFERDGAGRVVRLIDSWSDGHEESNLRAVPAPD